MNAAYYKKITSHGSISIPVALRRELGIEGRDPMVVERDGDTIKISAYTPRCIFCGTTEGVQKYHGKGVCKDCATKALEKIGGSQ